jgi:2-C-methyl-D-erythritol 4-phosphate cytidylyltransferase
MRAAVIIPAAGSGTRTGLKTPKPFILLDGEPLVLHSLRIFQRHRAVAFIQPVLPRDLLGIFHRRVLRKHPLTKCLSPVAGGRDRQDSVFMGLKALPEDVEIVVVHDAARPFVTAAVITRVIEAAAKHGAALAAIPARDTMKRGSRRGAVVETVDRSSLWHAQTPQAFRADLLREAHSSASSAGYRGTDDASLLERLGLPVRLVEGSSKNLKVTTSGDIALARALVRKR